MPVQLQRTRLSSTTRCSTEAKLGPNLRERPQIFYERIAVGEKSFIHPGLKQKDLREVKVDHFFPNQTRLKSEHQGGEILYLCPGSFPNVFSSPTAHVCFLFFASRLTLSSQLLSLRVSKFQGDNSRQGSEGAAKRSWMMVQTLLSSCQSSIPAQPYSNWVTLGIGQISQSLTVAVASSGK